MLSQPLSPPSEPALEPGAVTGYLGRERWVLLIDDDPEHLAMMRDLLGSLGFQVRTARDAETGLAIAAQVQPDLVLCDVMLGKESGWDLAARLRRRHGAALRIVMLSGEAARTAATSPGAAHDAFLSKPFDFTILLDLVAAQLGLAWVQAPGAPRPPQAGGAAPLPPALAARATPHCAAIERLVKIGHVRGIEAEIDAIAALGPRAAPLADRMRAALDNFDLQRLADLARRVQADAAK